MLKKYSNRISIIDFMLLNISAEEAISRINILNPGVIVLHSSTPSFKSDICFIRKIKLLLPHVKVILFGLHTTSCPEDILSSDIEYVVRAEPEVTVSSLVAAFVSDSKSLDGVLGISYWRNGRVFHNPGRGYIDDLDSLPFPAWEYLDVKKYVLPYDNNPFLIINVSRGCPFHCIFCTSHVYYGNRWRCRSPENVVLEIEEIVAKYGINNFLFLSDTFNFSKDFIFSLCGLIIRRELNIKWMCNSRVDILEKESLKIMKEAGCWLISLGIESASESILEHVNKGITARQSKDAISAIRKAGIKTLCYFVFGLPGENVVTIQKTIDFIKNCGCDYGHFYSATPFPGTEFYRLAKDAGWLLSEDWSRYSHGSSDVISYPQLSADAIRSSVTKAYRSFYLRPQVFWRELLSIKSPEQLISFLRIALDLFKISAG